MAEKFPLKRSVKVIVVTLNVFKNEQRQDPCADKLYLNNSNIPNKPNEKIREQN